MKYIFVAGAPGSKWSSVSKNIYYSPSIDRSDYRDDWTYYHDAAGQMNLMHMGAYFDPGMELDLPAELSGLDRRQLEHIFDGPFSKESTGARIIKSHIFSYKQNIQHLKIKFPESPIVLVYRSNDACLGWWVKCGHFNITYPKYQEYYKDLRTMSTIIEKQNDGILAAWPSDAASNLNNNLELCNKLGLELPPAEHYQIYKQHDIKVAVI